MTPDPEPDDSVPPLSDCEDGQCTIGVNYHPDFQGKASTTRKEPSYTATLSATTPDGTTYQQETDIEWQPPPNTAELIAKLKEDEGVR